MNDVTDTGTGLHLILGDEELLVERAVESKDVDVAAATSDRDEA